MKRKLRAGEKSKDCKGIGLLMTQTCTLISCLRLMGWGTAGSIKVQGATVPEPPHFFQDESLLQPQREHYYKRE